MQPFDSMFRRKNIKFYLLITKCVTVKLAAKEAGIGRQHGTRLAKVWRDSKWIERTGLYGSKYRYTVEGEKMKKALYRMGWMP